MYGTTNNHHMFEMARATSVKLSVLIQHDMAQTMVWITSYEINPG